MKKFCIHFSIAPYSNQAKHILCFHLPAPSVIWPHLFPGSRSNPLFIHKWTCIGFSFPCFSFPPPAFFYLFPFYSTSLQFFQLNVIWKKNVIWVLWRLYFTFYIPYLEFYIVTPLYLHFDLSFPFRKSGSSLSRHKLTPPPIISIFCIKIEKFLSQFYTWISLYIFSKSSIKLSLKKIRYLLWKLSRVICFSVF